MAGVLPARGMITGKVQALGYVEARAGGDAALLPPGLTYRGHEFHYSSLECDRDARFSLGLARGRGIGDGRDGLTEGQTVGAYTHAYFTDEFARSLVGAAKGYRRG